MKHMKCLYISAYIFNLLKQILRTSKHNQKPTYVDQDSNYDPKIKAPLTCDTTEGLSSIFLRK